MMSWSSIFFEHNLTFRRKNTSNNVSEMQNQTNLTFTYLASMVENSRMICCVREESHFAHSSSASRTSQLSPHASKPLERNVDFRVFIHMYMVREKTGINCIRLAAAGPPAQTHYTSRVYLSFVENIVFKWMVGVVWVRGYVWAQSKSGLHESTCRVCVQYVSHTLRGERV